MRASLVVVLLIAACSTDSLPAGDGAADFALSDFAGADLKSADLSSRDLTGAGTHACNNVNDCRRYSSNCDPPGCQCLALSNAEIDPVCAGNPIACLVDPCQVDNRTLACANNMCVLQ